MSEAAGSGPIQVRRAWKYHGEEEGLVHIELAAGGESLNVKLKAARNPRMVDFIMKHAKVSTETRPAKGDSSDE